MKVPVLVLSGAHDQLIPAAESRAMADALPDSTLVTLERSGHMPMLEEPDATTRALADFFGA